MVRMRNRSRHPGADRRGFSLTEVMVIILIVGLLAVMSAPPFFSYLQSNRFQTGMDRMMADLQYARAVAISNGEMLRFTSTTAGYTITVVSTGQVLRQTNFEHGLKLAVDQTAGFYPWGMADATVFNITNGDLGKQISLLPTGIVEVN